MSLRVTLKRCLIFFPFQMSETHLGPDLEPLEEEFQDLGKTHASFGVKPSFFYTLGEATFYGLDIVMVRYGTRIVVAVALT